MPCIFEAERQRKSVELLWARRPYNQCGWNGHKTFYWAVTVRWGLFYSFTDVSYSVWRGCMPSFCLANTLQPFLLCHLLLNCRMCVHSWILLIDRTLHFCLHLHKTQCKVGAKETLKEPEKETIQMFRGSSPFLPSWVHPLSTDFYFIKLKNRIE